MNPKLKKIVEDIDKMEMKIAEWQTQVKELKRQRKQLEDQEIIKTVRGMQLGDAELLRVLCGIQDGSICLSDIADGAGNENQNNMNSGEDAAESEDSTNEEVD